MAGFSLLLLHYYKAYKRPYLRFWSYAAAYYTLGCVASLSHILLAPLVADFAWQSWWLGTLHLGSLYLGLSLLTIGVFDITKQKPPKRAWRWVIYGFALSLSVVTRLGEQASSLVQPFEQDTLMFLVTGIGLVTIGAFILRYVRGSLGPRMIAFAFGLQGLKNIALVGIFQLTAPLLMSELVWALQGFLNLVC